MFVALLITLLSIALLITSIVVRVFRSPIRGILNRLIGDSLPADAWVNFLMFGLYVVGISKAVQAYRLDKYVTQQYKDAVVTKLNLNTWVLEIYQSVCSEIGRAHV